MRIGFFTLAIVAALGPVSAQTVWTVGPSGAQFPQLQPAIDAAAPGDIIEVKAGTYLPAEMTKGLSILAEPGTEIA